jgi:hypothetical protein
MPFDVDESRYPYFHMFDHNSDVWIMPIRDQEGSDEISRYRLLLFPSTGMCKSHIIAGTDSDKIYITHIGFITYDKRSMITEGSEFDAVHIPLDFRHKISFLTIDMEGDLEDIINSKTRVYYDYDEYHTYPISNTYGVDRTYPISDTEPIRELICHPNHNCVIPIHDYLAHHISLIDSNWDPILTHEFATVHDSWLLKYNVRKLMKYHKYEFNSGVYVRLTFEN